MTCHELFARMSLRTEFDVNTVLYILLSGTECHHGQSSAHSLLSRLRRDVCCWWCLSVAYSVFVLCGYMVALRACKVCACASFARAWAYCSRGRIAWLYVAIQGVEEKGIASLGKSSLNIVLTLLVDPHTASNPLLPTCARLVNPGGRGGPVPVASALLWCSTMVTCL